MKKNNKVTVFHVKQDPVENKENKESIDQTLESLREPRPKTVLEFMSDINIAKRAESLSKDNQKSIR